VVADAETSSRDRRVRGTQPVMRCLVVLLVACSASSPPGSGETSFIVREELPLGDGATSCFDVAIADPPDCVATLLRDGVEERVLGACELDPTNLCWRIEVDPVACPGAASQLVAFDNVTAADLPSVIVIECVSAAML
jgi:hypothetical protein